MSRGPGRIERAIQTAFTAEPDNAFTTEELCLRVYRVNQPSKKHRVAVLLAAHTLAGRSYDDPTVRPGLDWMVSERLGGQQIFFDRYDVISYTMAHLKRENYSGHDPRQQPYPWLHKSEAECRAMLDEPEYRERIAPDGHWRWHVRRWIAERDGDVETLTAAIVKNNEILSHARPPPGTVARTIFGNPASPTMTRDPVACLKNSGRGRAERRPACQLLTPGRRRQRTEHAVRGDPGPKARRRGEQTPTHTRPNYFG